LRASIEDHILRTHMADPASLTSLLRHLPSVDQLLRTEAAVKLRDSLGSQSITALARTVTDELRREIQQQAIAGDGIESATEMRGALLAEAVRRLESACNWERLAGLRRVINATGVIVHTNLGRSPLSDGAVRALEEAAGYCTLEYDVTTGARGKRGARVENLLVELTGAEDALVVNNCAAAALLILTVLAKDGETIVSRGELVEIGGDFRVPDVMANSGTRMIEVGTTNRTKLDDYRRALNERTRLIMRVHQSNYRIVGFTAAPEIAELATLAHEAGLCLYEDAGSGALVDLSKYGLADEPVIRESIARGADVVSFSGDKLLGGPQAGLIVGRRQIVSRLRKHPLYRALRADKLCLAALEATLESHRRDGAAETPVLRMLALTEKEIRDRAQSFIERHQQMTDSSDLELEILEGVSAIGGGSGPNTHPRTALIAIHHAERSAAELEHALRSRHPPIIARISEGRVLIDLRTVKPEEEAEMLTAISTLVK
jgi:L-seryl-tRNA(Ser) seleniumtransferase